MCEEIDEFRVNNHIDDSLESETGMLRSKRWLPSIVGGLAALLCVSFTTVASFYFLVTGVGDSLFPTTIPVNLGAAALVVLLGSQKTVISFLLIYAAIVIVIFFLTGPFGVILLVPLIVIVATIGGITAIREIYKACLKRFSQS